MVAIFGLGVGVITLIVEHWNNPTSLKEIVTVLLAMCNIHLAPHATLPPPTKMGALISCVIAIEG